MRRPALGSRCTGPFLSDLYSMFHRFGEIHGFHFMGFVYHRPGKRGGRKVTYDPDLCASMTNWLGDPRSARFAALAVSVKTPSGSMHANVMVFDRASKCIELFDPHGTLDDRSSAFQLRVSEDIRSAASGWLPKGDPKDAAWSFYGILQNSPVVRGAASQGPQAAEKDPGLRGSGNCAYWCLAFVVLKVRDGSRKGSLVSGALLDSASDDSDTGDSMKRFKEEVWESLGRKRSRAVMPRPVNLRAIRFGVHDAPRVSLRSPCGSSLGTP